MSRAFGSASLLLFVAAAPAPGQESGDFDVANQQFHEQSFARACAGFAAFLKSNPSSPLLREAEVKHLAACERVGKGSLSDLTKLADNGEKDFARAMAGYLLFQRGYRNFDPALPLLTLASKGEGRQAAEASQALVSGAFTEMERNTWNRARVDSMAQLVFDHASNETVRAHAHLLRARARLNDAKLAEGAEKELQEVSGGSTEWADDAEFSIAERHENQQRFTAALELYDDIVARFSPTTSNVLSDAKNRAENIRRPILSVSVGNVDLPGFKPNVSVSWRNVRDAHWTLSAVDPFQVPLSAWPDAADALNRAKVSVASTWSSTLDVPVKYAPGSKSFDLDLKEPGLYLLEVTADGKTARDWVLLTQTATVTKSDRNQTLVYVADVETGVAQPNAEVALTLWHHSDDHQRYMATTDAQGIARFKVGTTEAAVVWTKVGKSYSVAHAGNAYSSEYAREELAYIMSDRPLYKPGETVGLKVFLRSRDKGPSVPLGGRHITLYVTDPTGKRVVSQELTSNEFGTVTYALTLPKKATLGAWTTSVYSSSDRYPQRQTGFRVEEYKPPEYTVSVEPIGTPKPGDKVRFRVSAHYYSGGAVANAQGRALVQTQYWNHTFGPWPDEKLGDSGEEDDASMDEAYAPSPWKGRSRRYGNYPGYYGVIGQQTLTFKTAADGTAEVEIAAQQNLPPQVQYTVQVFVTDASRREISGNGNIRISTQPYFVDVRTNRFLYKPGERVTAQLRAEDANGLSVEPDVVVRLVRVAEDGKTSKIAEARTKVARGKGSVQLDADALGMVRAEVVDASATPEAVLAQTDLWLTNDTKPMLPPAAGFQLYTDRSPLKVGQKVRALVATNRPGGSVLLSLESDVVHFAETIQLNGRARFVELPLTAAMAPNCWLNATRFEDSMPLQQQQPLRVGGSDVALGVSVGFGRAVAEPGSHIVGTVNVTHAPEGTPVEVAMTVVDESLFAIEPERKDFMAFFGRHPAPATVRTDWSHNTRSYRQRPKPAQPVAQSDNKTPRDEDKREDDGLLHAKEKSLGGGAAALEEGQFGKKMAEPVNAQSAPARSAAHAALPTKDDAPGGRGAAGADVDLMATPVRSNFATTAGWFPNLTGGAGAPLISAVALSDSLTSWKAVATAVTPGPYLGVGSKSLRTAKALMVRLQAPRFFVEGDEVVLSAVVESHLPKAADIDVAIFAPGFVERSPSRKTVHIAPEQTLRFDAKFKVAQLGDRAIRAVAKGGGTSDAMEWKLPAFVHGSAQRQFFSGRLSDSFELSFDLPEKRKPALTQLELSLSPSLIAVMFDGLPYLAQYPYGCVEQTLSRFVPATIARRAVHDLHLPTSRVPADLDDMVGQGLQRLVDFQHGDGGWGWWHDDHTNDWMTAYVVYALSLAKEAGVSVDLGVLARGRHYLVERLGAALNEPETHAFMVFALSQTGGAPRVAVDKDFENRTSLSPKGRALVALSLLNGHDKRARIAVENLDDVVKAAQARKDAAVGDANDAWSTSAAIEATAFTLMAMERYDMKSPNVPALTDFLVLRRNGGKWRTTRDTAFAIYALSDLARREEASSRSGSFEVLVNGRKLKRIAYSQGGLDLASPLLLEDAALRPGHNVVQVRRDGAGTGYYAAKLDVFNMNDFIRGVGGDVKVKRTYTLLGKPSTEKASSPTEYGMPVEAGVRVRVDVEITANKAVEFVMLEDLKPAGFESVELRSGPQVCNYACAHAELRTDRVAMFLPELRVGTTRLSYELRAEVPGRFAALPARFEAMYAPEIQATSDEMRFEVRDEPSNAVAVH